MHNGLSVAKHEARQGLGTRRARDGRKRILVPIDFSSCSRAALRYAATVARGLDAGIELLHVWPSAAAPPPATRLSGQGAIERYALTRVVLAMEDLREEVKRQGVPWVRIRLERGTADEVILRVAREGHEAVVMGWHGATEHALLGRTADHVRREAPCPVLTIHGERGEREREGLSCSEGP